MSFDLFSNFLGGKKDNSSMSQISEQDEKGDGGNMKEFEWDIYNKSWFTVTNKNTIRRINDSSYWRPCYGKTIIDVRNNNNDNNNTTSKIKSVEWKIKINQTTSKNIMIGVCKDQWNTDIYGCYTTANGYLKNCNGPYLYHQSGNTTYGQAIQGTGTIIIMTFNAKERSLSFNVDGNDYKTAWTSLPSGQWRLAADILTANDEISVLYEKIVYDNHLLCTLEAVHQWKSDIEFAINSIDQQQKSIASIPVESLLKDVQYIPQVQSGFKVFEKNLQIYKTKLEAYERDLSKQLKPETKDYRKWKSEDIVKWILTLDNGIYSVYADKLCQAFKQNELTGEDLESIRREDLYLFGVTVFKHRVSLMKHFSNIGKNENIDDNNVGGGGGGANDENEDEDEGEHDQVTPID
jgi:hypothetical protein